MVELLAHIEDAKKAIQARWSVTPKIGIILGTGLGGFANQILEKVTIPYGEIAHFPESTVESHAGQLVCGPRDGAGQ